MYDWEATCSRGMESSCIRDTVICRIRPLGPEKAPSQTCSIRNTFRCVQYGLLRWQYSTRGSLDCSVNIGCTALCAESRTAVPFGAQRDQCLSLYQEEWNNASYDI